MQVNFFKILEFDKISANLNQDEIEDKYCKAQIKLMKNQADQFIDENLLNNAMQVLKNEKTRIEHMFEIIECDLDFKKNDIELEIQEDKDLMMYFFEMNDQIDELKNSIDSEKLNKLKIIEIELNEKKDNLIKEIDQNYLIKNYKDAYKSFLYMKYFFRSLEFVKNAKVYE